MIYAENILICIAVPLAISVIFVRGNARRFVLAFLAGMSVCLIAAYISGFAGMTGGMEENDTAIFISPIIEEILKFLPLLFYLVLFVPESENMFLVAAGLGAGFATFENCCHILSTGAGSLPYILIRGLAVGVMHIVSIMMLAMGLSLVRRFKAFSVAGIAGALTLSMTFHALYNLLVSEKGISSYIGYILPVLTAVLLYIPYRRFRSSD